VTPTRLPPTAVLCLLGAVVALGGCSGRPADGTAPAATERTVTELVPTSPPAITVPARASVPPNPGPSGPRPENGAVIVKRGASGRGELDIENGTQDDALVTLSLGGKAARAVYVRGTASTTLTGIADGTYDIFVTEGDGWNRELHRFTDSPQYTKFDDPASFQTVRETGAIRYTRLSITLQPVANGNVSTSPVDPDTFPA
jgi:hypothetical protein